MRRWFDGEQWADRWEPVETEAQKVTADGVKAMTVVVIAIAGVLAFAVVWWVLQAMVEAQRF